MKIAPVSGDLIVKLAIVGAAVAAVWFVVRRASNAGGQLVDAIGSTVSNAVDAVNPTNPENVAYHTANVIGGELAGDNPDAPGRNADGSWSLGAWLYDVTH